MANKNSIYIQSLVDFIRDTKPYHSKLDAVIEEYRFSDEMTVHFDERLFSSVLAKAAWPYSFFSGGVSVPAPTMPLHRVLSPQFRGFTLNSDPAQNRGAFKVNRDENTDLPLVPLAFDPKCLQGVGLADAFVQRDGLGTQNEALLEGHDVYLSHGAYVVDIKQTTSTQPLVTGRLNQTYEVDDGPFPLTVNLSFASDSLVITGPAVQVTLTQISVTGPGQVTVVGLSDDPNYAPLFAERRNDGVLAHATSMVQLQALQLSNPTSAINRVQDILDAIAAQLVLTPDATSSTELAALQAIIDTVNLPSSYEALINALVAASIPIIPGYTGWEGQDITDPYVDLYVDQVLASCSTSLFFNAYTDIGMQENGALRYTDIDERDDVSITNIQADPFRTEYEEYTLEAISSSVFLVRGSHSGPMGSVSVPGSFSSPQLSFDIDAETDPITVGTIITLTPASKVTVHVDAPLEAWSLIKVNPRAYSRPVLQSTRYGYIADQSSQPGFVTILDTGFPSTTVVLTATSSTSFTLSSIAEPLYTGVVTVGVPFNDGRLAFTIIQGSAYTFQAGDKFYIEIENAAPVAEDLDLYYGFDLDPYDANELVYNNVNSLLDDYLTTLDFGYDSRFISYDLSAFGLVIAPSAVNGRRWRLRALADLSSPLLLQNSSPTNMVNLLGTDDPTNPNAASQFDSTNDVTGEGPWTATDPDSVEDLRLWYADSFALEYYDDGLGIWISVDTIAINTPYSNVTHGLSFTIVPAAKPFIAASLHSSWITSAGGPFQEEDVDGGDVISWVVQNEAPQQLGPSSLTSPRAPRLIMHGDSFHHCTPAHWVLNWTSSATYTIQGTYSSGPNNGSLIFGSAPSINFADGYSYRNYEHEVHFTVVPGAVGLAPADQFTFETFERKPTYLVHGSVSGWQPDANLDEYYWNGKIGFKLRGPRAQLFEDDELLDGIDSWTSSLGIVNLEYLRKDTPAAVYIVRSHNDDRWTLYRNGEVVGYGETSVSDKYVTLELPPAIMDAELVLQLHADDHELALGTDLAIVRTSPGRSPTADDFVLFSRTEQDHVSVSIKAKDSAHAITLSELAPVTVDLRFVDHTTGSGVPLANTSPETAVLPGWIPALPTFLDGSSSTAEFGDTATSVVLTAAATGETIGTIASIGVTVDEPVLFTWNSDFAAKYLPLNAEATVVTLGSGLDDRVSVRMTEALLMLLSGGGLDDSTLFSDEILVSIGENNLMSILSTYEAGVNAAVADGPFAGFLPGYDNLPYDFELGGDPDGNDVGYYDAGQAFTDFFMQAQALAALQSPTPQELAQLNDLLGRISPYLDGDLASTTLEEFIAALDADPTVNYTPVFDFGLPALGHGIDILERSTSAAGASVSEAMIIQAVDAGYTYDFYGYGVGDLDEDAEVTLIALSSDLPPLPLSGLPPPLTTYAAFDTPLHFETPGRVFEIFFPSAVVSTPAFYIWRPSEAAPSVVPVVERLNDRSFRFSIPAASELKLIVS